MRRIEPIEVEIGKGLQRNDTTISSCSSGVIRTSIGTDNIQRGSTVEESATIKLFINTRRNEGCTRSWRASIVFGLVCVYAARILFFSSRVRVHILRPTTRRVRQATTTAHAWTRKHPRDEIASAATVSLETEVWKYTWQRQKTRNKSDDSSGDSEHGGGHKEDDVALDRSGGYLSTNSNFWGTYSDCWERQPAISQRQRWWQFRRQWRRGLWWRR